MFIRLKDDYEFNVGFVELIRDNPCLYDIGRRDYHVRSTQDKAWKNISKEIKVPIHECKERWKNIRGRYSKYVKQRNLPTGMSRKPVKEYYLAESLGFIDKFLKPRSLKNGRPQTGQPSEDEIENHDKPMDEQTLQEEQSSSSREVEQSETVSEIEQTKLVFADVEQSEELYYEETRPKTSSARDNPDEADMSFLRSVLPDMNLMTPEQKRRFKVAIINLAGEILEEPVPESNFSLKYEINHSWGEVG